MFATWVKDYDMTKKSRCIHVFGCVYGLYQGGCDTLPMVLSNEELMLGYI